MKAGVIESTGWSCRRAIAWLVSALTLVGSAPTTPAIIEVSEACELAAAIESANNDSPIAGCTGGSGADTIRLTGNVTLSTVDNSTDGDNGLPSIVSEITIDGAGYTIQRDGAAPSFRIFHVASGGDLMLNDVTVSGGRLEGANGSGGGVFNRGMFALTNGTLSGHVIDTNTGGYGGGIYNLGTTVLYSSTVSGNQVDAKYAFGGGVFSYLGGVLNAQVSAISGNSLVGSIVGGAGVETWGIATLTQSTVSGNGAQTTSPYSQLTGVGIELVSGSLTLSASTVSGNFGSSDAYAAILFGGGVSVDDGLLNISSSTISSNSLSVSSGFAAVFGGGLDHGDSMGTISFSTFSGNSVSATFQQEGGAIYLAPGAGVSLISTVIGNSDGDNCGGTGTFNDVQNNLADDSTCATVSPTLVGLNPSLADNGGPTRTHALLEGSTAIGHAGVCNIPTDQRGVERDDGACDSGSFELNECLAPDGNQAIAEGMVAGEETIEVCYSISTGESLVVLGPGGQLILRAGALVSLGNGTEVESGGELTIEIDPALQM